MKLGLKNSYNSLTDIEINNKNFKIFSLLKAEKNGLEGIDRIVPIGSSHNIGFIWDGYNIDKQLTRIIEVN